MTLQTFFQERGLLWFQLNKGFSLLMITWSQVLKKDRKYWETCAHIPHALSVQYRKKEKELQTIVTQEDDRNSSKTENKFINLK